MRLEASVLLPARSYVCTGKHSSNRNCCAVIRKPTYNRRTGKHNRIHRVAYREARLPFYVSVRGSTPSQSVDVRRSPDLCHRHVPGSTNESEFRQFGRAQLHDGFSVPGSTIHPGTLCTQNCPHKRGRRTGKHSQSRRLCTGKHSRTAPVPENTVHNQSHSTKFFREGARDGSPPEVLQVSTVLKAFHRVTRTIRYGPQCLPVRFHVPPGT